MSSPQPIAEDTQASLTAGIRALAEIFRHGEIVWIIDTLYEQSGPVWRLTLICPGPRSGWMRRRYRYDIPSGTLHFTGETPAGEAELAAARRSGRRL
jgi:hypothetical protein